MRVKNSVPVDTVLNEFVYTVLFKADYEQKRLLKGKFLRASVNEKTARVFADASSLEEKMYVLSHLGFEFYFVINKSQKALAGIKDLLPVMESGKKSASSTKIAEKGAFVTSEREILRTLGLAARMTHHPSYQLDLEILRQGYHIEKWSKRYAKTKDISYREADECSRRICITLFNGILEAKTANGKIKCTENELLMLLYLYGTNSVETKEDELKDILAGRMNSREYCYAFRGMVQKGYAHRVSGSVSISGEGIKRVSNYFTGVIHSNNF
jgi:hypothetical protein